MRKLATSTVSGKGWVVIPREIREKYGLQRGAKVHVVDLGGHIILIPAAKDPVAAARGMLKGGPPMTEGLLADRRRELEAEERDLPPPRRDA